MDRLLVITGPTACGKTDIAISLAQETDGAIVSADSRQVYAGMNIGTAKPKFAWSDKVHDFLTADFFSERVARREGSDRTEFRGAPAAGLGAAELNVRAERVPAVTGPVPHYCFNIRQPNEPLSLSEWQQMAFSVIDQTHEAGMPAVLAGGTMLYIDSIIKNYNLPHVAPNEPLRQTLEEKPVEHLFADLIQQDPAATTFIEPANKRRIIRALEVIAATGLPFSAQRQQQAPRYGTETVGLFDTWEALTERITSRIHTMFKKGLLEETQRLVNHYGHDLPLLQTINYKQALAVLAGELTETAAHTEMLRANLKYARRQMSWWRGRTDITWYSPFDYAGIKKRLLGS